MQIKETADVGVIIARFQTPYLHEGHIDIIEQVRKNHVRVIIFLGCSQLRFSKNNPYDFLIRKTMIEEKYPDVEVYSIDDVGDNILWSKSLDRSIRKYTGPHLKIVLYGSRDSFISSYHGVYPTLELIPTKHVSARDIRRAVSIKATNSLDFRIGIVHAIENQHIECIPTVDIAVIDRASEKILLGRKSNESLWRFPGGKASVKSASYEEDAIRECNEKTGISIPDVTYIGSQLIDDNRYRSEPSKMKTMLYTSNYDTSLGVAKANDDLEDVSWFALKELFNDDRMSYIVVNAHIPLMKMFRQWYNKISS